MCMICLENVEKKQNQCTLLCEFEIKEICTFHGLLNSLPPLQQQCAEYPTIILSFSLAINAFYAHVTLSLSLLWSFISCLHVHDLSRKCSKNILLCEFEIKQICTFHWQLKSFAPLQQQCAEYVEDLCRLSTTVKQYNLQQTLKKYVYSSQYLADNCYTIYDGYGDGREIPSK